MNHRQCTKTSVWVGRPPFSASSPLLSYRSHSCCSRYVRPTPRFPLSCRSFPFCHTLQTIRVLMCTSTASPSADAANAPVKNKHRHSVGFLAFAIFLVDIFASLLLSSRARFDMALALCIGFIQGGKPSGVGESTISSLIVHWCCFSIFEDQDQRQK